MSAVLGASSNSRRASRRTALERRVGRLECLEQLATSLQEDCP